MVAILYEDFYKAQIIEFAKEKDLRVIEDAAHAFGSSYKGKKIGSFGDISCFSFDPIKNITCGEGGAVTFQDSDMLEVFQQKRILGIDKDTWARYRNERSWFYDVVTQGFRYHMSNINAAIGLEQLKKYEFMNDKKVKAAKIYDNAFIDLEGVTLLRNDSYKDIGFFTYVLLVENNRDQLMEYMISKGVGCGIHYIPSHVFSFYQNDGIHLPVTENIYRKILTLPLYADIAEDEVEKVISTFKSGLAGIN